MRKAQKQQAEELLKQMGEAHGQIKEYIGQGRSQYAMELLEDCQNGGITIGILIEESEGEGHPTVAFLEDYCELVYQIHEDLAGNKEANADKIYKFLRQKLIKVENSLRNDVPARTEAVFLPYKASMWDSLESVWKAADAAPDCDAYVIPIPYYDKNPDGSLRKMHYEGSQYPDYVPITKYDEYDFEKRRPDAIYIHNPYDQYNLVTSVPPFFFSGNLKKFTDKLVYIPYFVLGEMKPDEDERIERMKHFVTMPAVFNADEVIVQSEDMKQVYIKVLLDATNNHSEVAKKYWDDKILGLGSPKIDKVLNTKKEDLEIPQEWLKVIEKPDGRWKKIIFYNTSVAALLQHNEKMLEKMQYVFDVFRENQDEVVLLWRPHPLIKATIESMRPQLWTGYDKLVRKFREEGWGIYDDSSDVDRAIVLSDAYYGDGSSVVQMYQQTGKPIMMQDCNQTEKSEKLWHRLLFDGGAVFENKIWCTQTSDSCIYTIDLNTAEIDYVGQIIDNKVGRRYFFGIIEKAKKLYLMPGMSNYFAEYNPYTKEKKIYPYNNRNATHGLYGSTAIYGEQLYMFPVREKCIVRFSIKTGKQSFIELPEVFREDKIEFNKKGYFTKRNIVYQDWVIIPCAYQNKILYFNLKTEQFTWKQINGILKGFLDIAKQGDEMILLSQEREIYRGDIMLDGKIEKVMKLQDKYSFLIPIDNRYFLIPVDASKIAVLDITNRNLTHLDYPENIRFEMSLINEGLNNYNGIIESDNKMFFIPTASNMLLSIECNTGNIQYKEWNLKPGIYNHLRKYAACGELILYESDISFQFFLECISST